MKIIIGLICLFLVISCNNLTILTEIDNDGDGSYSDEDCDDYNSDIHEKQSYFVDSDLDGYGSLETVLACSTTALEGYSLNNTDCDDSDPNINPGADEVCDGEDNNCNESKDEDVTITYYSDSDNDGYGDPSLTQNACAAPTNYVANYTDCDDSDPNINPDADEVCDGEDNNCDGSKDEGLATYLYYQDNDGDTYGNPSVSQNACVAPINYVADNTDCDDTTNAIKPGATEICDEIDNNCIGGIDEGVTNTYYSDSDNDGYGDPGVSQNACEAPINYVADNTDCDDSNPNINPDADEVCDGEDNNCIGGIDEGVTSTYYYDSDSDGYGDPSVSQEACGAPTDYVFNDVDLFPNDSLRYTYQWTVSPKKSTLTNRTLAVDSSGNTYYIVMDHKEYNVDEVSVQKVLADGTLSELRLLSQIGRKTSIAVDSEDNIYILGSFYNGDGNGGWIFLNGGDTNGQHHSEGRWDIFLLKLDSNLDYIWSRSFGGAQSEDIFDITFDNDNNVYITGEFHDTVDFDFTSGVDSHYSAVTAPFVTKLTKDGNYKWTKSHSNVQNFASSIDSVLIDGSSNVYVRNAGGSIIKFDSLGDKKWHNDYGITIKSWALDNITNNIFIAGTKKIIKILPENGSMQSSIDLDVSFSHISFDSSNSLFVAGEFSSIVDFDPSNQTYQIIPDSKDGFIMKTNSSLNDLSWVYNFGEVINSFEFDSDGNIYATGEFNTIHDFDFSNGVDTHNPDGKDWAFVTKIMANGSYGWTKSFGTTSRSSTENNGQVSGEKLYIDDSDFVYVSGPILVNDIDFDFSDDEDIISYEEGEFYSSAWGYLYIQSKSIFIMKL